MLWDCLWVRMLLGFVLVCKWLDWLLVLLLSAMMALERMLLDFVLVGMWLDYWLGHWLLAEL